MDGNTNSVSGPHMSDSSLSISSLSTRLVPPPPARPVPPPPATSPPRLRLLTPSPGPRHRRRIRARARRCRWIHARPSSGLPDPPAAPARPQLLHRHGLRSSAGAGAARCGLLRSPAASGPRRGAALGAELGRSLLSSGARGEEDMMARNAEKWGSAPSARFWRMEPTRI